MKAGLMTKRGMIRTVASRWRSQYGPHPDNLMPVSGKSKAQILAELDAMDPETATEDDVEAIIGNRSWTRMTCDGCNKDVGVLVTVGAEPDYGSATANLCPDCLTDAFNLLKDTP